MRSTGEGGGAGIPGTRCQIDVDGDGRFYWRLTAQNGRVVAVSATAFEDYGSCRRAFERLCAEGPAMPGGVQHSEEGSGWVWMVRDAPGTASVAVSARAYERHSTCQAAYERFRALLAELAGSGGAGGAGGGSGGGAGGAAGAAGGPGHPVAGGQGNPEGGPSNPGEGPRISKGGPRTSEESRGNYRPVT
ncbi:hypothetical protein ACH429_16020 [Streptomyces pathocidini]|uniref:DUF1508 domain-containing protein n=1 Tax=Streptomyces pathocidini TaxID=1650571 RepID=A0ABW7UUY9_9ACTN